MVENINSLIQAAEEIINAHGDGKNHTVGAAILTEDGDTITAVNVFHFTGGPCAELSALANAVSQGKTNLKTIVAVGDRNRGVLSPCGRCRQVLLEYCPEINVVVIDSDKPILKPIKELLPYTYYWKIKQPE